jgi:hypothetical protein
VSRFRRSPGCSADTVKAALGRGFRPSSRNQDQQQQRHDGHVRLHEFDQGTASDGRQRRAELGAERHCGEWFLIGSNWGSTGEAPLVDTLVSIKDSAQIRRSSACAKKEGDQLQMILGRPGQGARAPALSGIPLNNEYRNDVQTMTGLGALVIKAVPSMAHAKDVQVSSTSLTPSSTDRGVVRRTATPHRQPGSTAEPRSGSRRGRRTPSRTGRAGRWTQSCPATPQSAPTSSNAPAT